ncbi:MAG: DUF4136 domain-containing protein [Bacteroidetes bacterium]|nr:DUF4136 domain-containing protein [Bacteroidota bacterium]
MRSCCVFILVPLLLVSCAEGVHTSSWRAKGVDLNKYKTYAWLAPGDSVLNSRRDDKLYAGTIQHAADEEMKKKGMIIDVQQPDVILMFDTHLEDMMKYSQSPTVSVGVGFGGPGYYVGGMAPVAGGEITASPYKQGTLVIEMYDIRSQQPVWRGIASSGLDYQSDVQTIIQTAVRNMFMYLPIKHKK